MASSGTITGSFNGSNAQYLTFRCEWSVTSQDLANKTSNVRLRWIVTKTTSNLYTNKSSTPWSQVCDSTTTSGTLSFNLGNVSANTDYVVRDVTVTIAHASDGTKTASINGTLDLSGTSAGTGTFSGSMALPTIATTPPTVSSLTLSDVGTKPSGVSAYVAGYTKFRLTATATPVSPATISTYAFYNGNTLLQSGSSNVFTYSSANTAGSYTFKVIVTDSYGNSTTKTNSAVTVVSYSVPTVSATTFRCNSSGTADGSGTYASLKMTWTIANISGNSATVHKVNFNGADTTLTSGTAVIKSGVSTSSAYTATYTVTDSFGNSATISQTIQSEFVNFDLYPDSTTGGMGVGMTAESGLASFNMPIKPYKGIRVTAYFTPSSVADINAQILSTFASMNQQTVAWIEGNPTTSIGAPFNGGGIIMFQIEKAAAAYGQVKATTYASNIGVWEWKTSIYNNAITGWTPIDRRGYMLLSPADYTVNSGYFTLNNSYLTADSIIIIQPTYYDSSVAPSKYTFTAHPNQAGKAYIYVRDGNGNNPADGTKVRVAFVIYS